MAEQLGRKVSGTIMAQKGDCAWGHKVGDKYQLSGYTPDGLCGFFYHSIYPYLLMLQFGGQFPHTSGGSVLEFDCPDHINTVRIQLRPE